MRVRALKECFHHGRRRKGEVFEYEPPEGGKFPDWLEEVPDTTPEGRPGPVPEPPEPQVALSEMTRQLSSSDPTGSSEDADPGIEHEFLR